MLSQFLLKNAEEVLNENFRYGVAIDRESRDVVRFRELLTTKTRLKCVLSDDELVELIRSVGTFEAGRVYPPKNRKKNVASSGAEESAASNEKSPNDAASNDRRDVKQNDETSSIPRAPRKRTPPSATRPYANIKKFSRDELPPEIFESALNILHKRFKNGLDLERAQDLGLFRACDPALFYETSDVELRTVVASAGILVGSKVYVVLETGRQYLTRLVRRLFENEGFGVIYFETLFERYKETLAKHRFVSLELLTDRLRVYFPNYAFYDDYFEPTKSALSESEIVLREIERVWEGDETSISDLAAWTLIPEEIVEYYLAASPEYDLRDCDDEEGDLNGETTIVRSEATTENNERDVARQVEANEPTSLQTAISPQRLQVAARQVLRKHFPRGCKADGAALDVFRFGRLLSQETGQTLDLSKDDLLRLLYASGRAGGGGKIYPADSFVRDEKRDAREENVDDEIKTVVASAVANNFMNGFSLTSDVDAATLRRCEPSLGTLSDSELRKLVASVGNRVGDRVYVSVKDERTYLTELVAGLFADGRRVVYYETFFERFKPSLIERRLVSLDLLKKRLRAYFPNYSFYDEFFEAEETPASEPKRALTEIERVWNGEEIALDVLADWVLIPKAKIRAYLNASPKYKYCGGGRYAAKAAVAKPTANVEKTSVSDVDVESTKATGASEENALQLLLSERFPNGFRLDSTIESKKLRRYVVETGNPKLANLAQLDEKMLQDVVKDVGTVYEGKVYVADASFDATIKRAVENAFESGAQTVFYESLLAKIVASAPDYFSPNLLKERVEALFGDTERKLIFAKNYVNIYIYIYIRREVASTTRRRSGSGSRPKFFAFGATPLANAFPIFATGCRMFRRRKSTPFSRTLARF